MGEKEEEEERANTRYGSQFCQVDKLFSISMNMDKCIFIKIYIYVDMCI